jgi:hypothetical protein
MQTGYRLPKTPLPPGSTAPQGETTPVTWLNVKSLITWPLRDMKLEPDAQEVRGVAWTGRGHVTSVEFCTDTDPRWKPARLIGDTRTGSWRQFRARWEPKPGRHVLRVRATDSQGQTQPEITAWNKSGYLWNGIDEVTCVVG